MSASHISLICCASVEQKVEINQKRKRNKQTNSIIKNKSSSKPGEESI